MVGESNDLFTSIFGDDSIVGDHRPPSPPLFASGGDPPLSPVQNVPSSSPRFDSTDGHGQDVSVAVVPQHPVPPPLPPANPIHVAAGAHAQPDRAATPPSARPRSGPGSRTRVKEVPRDELDEVIFGMFPQDVLRMSGADFKAWKRENVPRGLNKAEKDRLTEIRRRLAARAGAHQRRIDEKKRLEHAEQVLAHNHRLTCMVAELQSEVARLRAQVAKTQCQ